MNLKMKTIFLNEIKTKWITIKKLSIKIVKKLKIIKNKKLYRLDQLGDFLQGNRSEHLMMDMEECVDALKELNDTSEVAVQEIEKNY